METEDALKRSIRTADDLHSLVKTMKVLAAVNIRHFERAVDSLADYQRTIELGLQAVLMKGSAASAKARPGPTGRLGAVVFGSDQGMCGQLNDLIASHAQQQLDRYGVDRGSRKIVTVGSRVAAWLADAGQPVEQSLIVPSSMAGMTPLVQDVLLRIEKWHSQQQINKVVICFSEHLARAVYRPTTVELLPIDQAWLARLEKNPWPTNMLPLFTMDADRLFSSLVRQYLFVSIYRACAESLASENAARLASMRGAERNIEDRIDELTKEFHRQRQTTITGELLDIASGYEALTAVSA